MNEPKSAKRSQRHYQLWKLAETLTPNEIRYLITVRKEKIKYEKDSFEIKELRTDIKILEDEYKIIKRKYMEEK